MLTTASGLATTLQGLHPPQSFLIDFSLYTSRERMYLQCTICSAQKNPFSEVENIGVYSRNVNTFDINTKASLGR